jgi:hypothetical protein
MSSPRGVRLLHTIVAMGVALTGGGVAAACGGVTEGPIPTDGGEGGDEHYAHIGALGDERYGLIDAGGGDAYAHIGIDEDAYPTIHPDGYAHIGIDAGAPDGYPIIY